MGEVFSSSGEKTDNVVVPTPRLRGLFLPSIDNPSAIDGFGTVIPWGGGSVVRRYNDYGISTDISSQNTQLRDLTSSFIPAEGAGVTYNFEGLVGPQGPPGPAGPAGIIGLTSLPSGYVLPVNTNYVAALPHNIDQINTLGTALNKLVYTDSYDTYLGDFALTERRPAGDVDRAWYGVASDSDGSHLIAGIDEGRLYTSDDSGATWTERQPAGVADKVWYAVASDSDGSHLIAAAYGGRLYTSANSGVGWTERQPAGNNDIDWDTVASDSDGSHLIAGIDFGRLYTSANSGVGWTERQPAGASDKVWYAVASDSDGSHLIAAVQGGRLYTSANSGVGWTERQPAGASDINWASVASDSDGSHLIVGVLSGRLYTSDDSGATWTERQPAGDTNQDWEGVASDSDGSHLIAAARAGRIYTSDDSGANWTIVSGDADWRRVASDSDGSNLIVGEDSSSGPEVPYRLYTGERSVLYSEATWAESALTSAGRDILGDATAADQATTLGLGTGDSPTWAGAIITGCSVLGLNSADFQPTTDSTTFFQVKNAAGTAFITGDSTNKKVKIGTAGAPLNCLDVVAEGANVDIAPIVYGSAYRPGISAYTARGTEASPSATQNADILLFFGGRGYGTTGFGGEGSNAAVILKALENFTDSAKGTQISFETTPIGGVTRATVGTFDSTGRLTVNSDNGVKINAPVGLPRFEFYHNGARKWLLYSDSNYKYNWKTNTDIRMVLQQDGFLGLGGETVPETLTEWTHAQPYLTLHCSVETDDDSGRKSRLNFKGEQSGGEETTLARIEVGHDGSADDEKGYIDGYTNSGSDGDSPTKQIRIQSTGNWIINKTSGVGIKVDLVAPTFGWRDLEGFEIPDPTGGDRPTLSTYSGGSIKENAFSNGDVLRIRYHIPHDYVKGTDIFSHIHWSHNGTAISGNVVFGVTSDYAKGHNQANFGTEKSISITYATTDISTTPRYRHRIEESAITNDGGSATLIDRGLLEPDGIILVTFELTTNPTITGGSPNNVFVHRADLHYQSTNIATKDKAPDFYT